MKRPARDPMIADRQWKPDQRPKPNNPNSRVTKPIPVPKPNPATAGQVDRQMNSAVPKMNGPPTKTPPADPGAAASDSPAAEAAGTVAPAERQTTPEPVREAAPGVGEGQALPGVSGRLKGLLSEDSPYIDRARTSARQAANRRGLMNSSIAAGAGEAAAIDAALPIAQADAGIAAGERGMRSQEDMQAREHASSSSCRTRGLSTTKQAQTASSVSGCTASIACSNSCRRRGLTTTQRSAKPTASFQLSACRAASTAYSNSCRRRD